MTGLKKIVQETRAYIDKSFKNVDRKQTAQNLAGFLFGYNFCLYHQGLINFEESQSLDNYVTLRKNDIK